MSRGSLCVSHVFRVHYIGTFRKSQWNGQLSMRPFDAAFPFGILPQQWYDMEKP